MDLPHLTHYSLPTSQSQATLLSDSKKSWYVLWPIKKTVYAKRENLNDKPSKGLSMSANISAILNNGSIETKHDSSIENGSGSNNNSTVTGSSFSETDGDHYSEAQSLKQTDNSFESETSQGHPVTNNPGVRFMANPTDAIEALTPESTSQDIQQASVTLVTTPPQPDSVKRAVITIDLSDADPATLPTTEEFRDVILDANNYPMDAKYWGVKVLLDCRSLGVEEGYHMTYQRTAPPPGGSARHYVVALKTSEFSSSKVRVGWNSISETDAQASYASILAADPDAVYTPFNEGYWEYDQAAKTITYSLAVDSGGNIPNWLVKEGALLAFPKKLLQDKWGIRI